MFGMVATEVSSFMLFFSIVNKKKENKQRLQAENEIKQTDKSMA